MPYGLLTPEMKAIIERTVRGKRVVDLGAGDLTYARMLESFGAWVVAVDKDIPGACIKMLSLTKSKTFRLAKARFDEFASSGSQYDVAFVSWPYSYDILAACVRPAKSVIYLGLNDDTLTTCGAPGLWEELKSRCIRKVVEHPRNTLIVYGRHTTAKTRRRLAEEENGLRVWGKRLDSSWDDW